MLQEASPRRHYRHVADQILAFVSAQGIAPGERLPSERDMAEQFSLSRPSLREALIALEVEGHVEIRMGSGIYVSNQPDPGMRRVDGESPFEILQARCIIESAVAEEAARHATPALIAALDRNLTEMAGAIHDTPRMIRLDGAFHIEIAEGIGNSVLTGLLETSYKQRLSPIFARFSSYFEGPRTWRLALSEHGAIRDAIADADPAAAREAMRHHLTESQRRFAENALPEAI